MPLCHAGHELRKGLVLGQVTLYLRSISRRNPGRAEMVYRCLSLTSRSFLIHSSPITQDLLYLKGRIGTRTKQ